MLLVVFDLALALLCLFLQACGLLLHRHFQILHFLLPLRKNLTDLCIQMSLLFPEEPIELFLVVPFLLFDPLDLTVEFSLPLIELLRKPLFFTLKLLDVLF